MRIKLMLMDRYEKVYAPEQQGYYYYDKVKMTTSWTPPLIFKLFNVELEVSTDPQQNYRTVGCNCYKALGNI